MNYYEHMNIILFYKQYVSFSLINAKRNFSIKGERRQVESRGKLDSYNVCEGPSTTNQRQSGSVVYFVLIALGWISF